MVHRVLGRLVLAAALLVAACFSPQVQRLSPAAVQVHEAVVDGWALIAPGGKLHPASFIEHKGHFVLEGCLLVVISYLLIQGSFKPRSKEAQPLSEKEVDELCAEWQPEPLEGSITDAQRLQLQQQPVISSDAGVKVTVNGKQALNFASFNFLGLAGNKAIEAKCEATIDKYGVGSCGPRGFYGTIDVHLQLEERLAQFMGVEEAILYSYDLATLPSVIPAFANKKDLIICDEGVNYGIQNGCHLSRARVLYFKHNDVADLEAVLQRVAAEDKRSSKPLNRRFIAVEGIYANYGDVAPLDKIKELKEKYRYRLIVDEALSLGVLGAKGRGACEHFGYAPSDVEFVGGSLGNSLASIGGFCSGEREIVDHQRLSGLGYCFSASLPPYLATGAITALDQLQSEEGPKLMADLRANAAHFRRTAVAQLAGLLRVVGARQGAGAAEAQADEESPVIHLVLDPSPPRQKYLEGDLLLQRVVDDCLAREGVLFAAAKYSSLERSRPQPSIRVAVSADHTTKQVEQAVAALRASCKRVLA